jgi:hypothetical protein
MIKIKAKLILAFIVTVLICSILALAVSYGGYTLVVAGIAASVDNNNGRVADIIEMKDLLAAQQKIIAGSVISLDPSASEEFDKNTASLIGRIDLLSDMSESKEKAILKELRELDVQYAGANRAKITDAVKKSDPSGYKRLFADFNKQYGDLISKELELKKQIRLQVDALNGTQLTDIAGMKTLTEDQQTALDSLSSALDKVLDSYKITAAANTQLVSDEKALQSQIAELQNEISALKTGQTSLSNGNSPQQAPEPPIQDQSTAGAYDGALADTVRSYLEAALQSNTDTQTVLNRLLASALTGTQKADTSTG